MTDFSDFKRGQIVGARMAGASVTETAELFGVSRSTVSRLKSAFEQEEKHLQIPEERQCILKGTV